LSDDGSSVGATTAIGSVWDILVIKPRMTTQDDPRSNSHSWLRNYHLFREVAVMTTCALDVTEKMFPTNQRIMHQPSQCLMNAHEGTRLVNAVLLRTMANGNDYGHVVRHTPSVSMVQTPSSWFVELLLDCLTEATRTDRGSRAWVTCVITRLEPKHINNINKIRGADEGWFSGILGKIIITFWPNIDLLSLLLAHSMSQRWLLSG